jgi:putative PIN family toxin of toxin-antitoxin system
VKIVIDTNVFVSSVFGGLPRQVVQLWFDGRVMLCLSEPIVTEYQRVLREIDAVSEAEERALIEAFASGEGVLYTSDPPPIEGVSPDPEDDKFLECALELGASCIASGDSDWSLDLTWGFRSSRHGSCSNRLVKRLASNLSR